VQIAEQGNDHFASPEIEIAGGLVSEQNTRVANERSCQSDPLLLSARKFSRTV
jgi:hypothetical protein